MSTISLSPRDRRTLARLRRDVRRRGIALVEGCYHVGRAHHPMLYTVGLTRHRGHPELMATGEALRGGQGLLRSAAELVADGVRLAPGWELITEGAAEYRVTAVDDPEILMMAQLMYAPVDGPPVPALHLTRTHRNREGH